MREKAVESLSTIVGDIFAPVGLYTASIDVSTAFTDVGIGYITGHRDHGASVMDFIPAEWLVGFQGYARLSTRGVTELAFVVVSVQSHGVFSSCGGSPLHRSSLYPLHVYSSVEGVSFFSSP